MADRTMLGIVLFRIGQSMPAVVRAAYVMIGTGLFKLVGGWNDDHAQQKRLTAKILNMRLINIQQTCQMRKQKSSRKPSVWIASHGDGGNGVMLFKLIVYGFGFPYNRSQAFAGKLISHSDDVDAALFR